MKWFLREGFSSHFWPISCGVIWKFDHSMLLPFPFVPEAGRQGSTKVPGQLWVSGSWGRLMAGLKSVRTSAVQPKRPCPTHACDRRHSSALAAILCWAEFVVTIQIISSSVKFLVKINECRCGRGLRWGPPSRRWYWGHGWPPVQVRWCFFGGFETGLEAFASVPAGTSHDDF